MALHSKEVAILFAIDTGLKFMIAPQDEVFVQGTIACGYVLRDRKTPPGELSQFAHDGDVPYGLRLTEEGKSVVQLIKNELAAIGLLDMNEARPIPNIPVDVTPRRVRIGSS